MPGPKVLLTWDGKLLAAGMDGPGFRPVELMAQDVDLLRIDLPNQPSFTNAFTYGSEDTVSTVVSIEDTGNVAASFSDRHLAWHLQDATDRFLCRDPHGATVSFTRETASEWEAFISLDGEELSALQRFMAERWVYRGHHGEIVPCRPRWIAPFTVRLGSINIDLRLQAIAQLGRSRVAVTYDDWKTVDIYRYRPLIFITAYSSPPVLDQMRLCVESLRTFGTYEGPILLMTDLAEAQVKEMFGKEGIDFGQIIVLNLPAKDFVGFVCSKYSILDYEQFEGFQPLLYLDPDIVIDRPIEPMLAAVASSGRICAPAEGWNQVHHHVPVGASLLRMDNVECRFMPGLNGGTIGFPALDTPDVRNTIERIRRTIACLGRRFGRTFNGWADQEAMNYVAIKTDSFDSTTITPFVTHYVPSTETLGGPRGLVHFWGRTSTGKADAMANYVRSLKEHGVATAQDAHVNSGPLLYSSDDLSRGQPALPVLKLSDDETSS